MKKVFRRCIVEKEVFSKKANCFLQCDEAIRIVFRPLVCLTERKRPSSPLVGRRKCLSEIPPQIGLDS